MKTTTCFYRTYVWYGNNNYFVLFLACRWRRIRGDRGWLRGRHRHGEVFWHQMQGIWTKSSGCGSGKQGQDLTILKLWYLGLRMTCFRLKTLIVHLGEFRVNFSPEIIFYITIKYRWNLCGKFHPPPPANGVCKGNYFLPKIHKLALTL